MDVVPSATTRGIGDVVPLVAAIETGVALITLVSKHASQTPLVIRHTLCSVRKAALIGELGEDRVFRRCG
jgi:hypothetical protein